MAKSNILRVTFCPVVASSKPSGSSFLTLGALGFFSLGGLTFFGFFAAFLFFFTGGSFTASFLGFTTLVSGGFSSASMLLAFSSNPIFFPHYIRSSTVDCTH